MARIYADNAATTKMSEAAKKHPAALSGGGLGQSVQPAYAGTNSGGAAAAGASNHCRLPECPAGGNPFHLKARRTTRH